MWSFLWGHRNRFFWLHRAFRICSTWCVFGPCFDKGRLRDLPRQLARHGWNYLYLWQFLMHLTDNTDSNSLLSLSSALILPLLTLNARKIGSKSSLQLRSRNTFCMWLLPSASTALYFVKYQSQVDQTVLQWKTRPSQCNSYSPFKLWGSIN